MESKAITLPKIPSHVFVCHIILSQDSRLGDVSVRNGTAIYGVDPMDMELSRRPYPVELLKEINENERIWLVYRKGGR